MKQLGERRSPAAPSAHDRPELSLRQKRVEGGEGQPTCMCVCVRILLANKCWAGRVIDIIKNCCVSSIEKVVADCKVVVYGALASVSTGLEARLSYA